MAKVHQDGRLLRRTSPEGVVETCVHDDRGLLVARHGPLGVLEQIVRDAEGRPIRIVDAEGLATEFAYDRQDHLVAAGSTGAVASWQHDAEGRVLRSVDAAGGVTTCRYNEQGLLAQVTNPAGQARILWWDPLARLVAEVGFDGVRRYFGYDADDRIVSVNVQERVTARYRWDAVGRLESRTDGDARRPPDQRAPLGRVRARGRAGPGGVDDPFRA